MTDFYGRRCYIEPIVRGLWLKSFLLDFSRHQLRHIQVAAIRRVRTILTVDHSHQARTVEVYVSQRFVKMSVNK